MRIDFPDGSWTHFHPNLLHRSGQYHVLLYLNGEAVKLQKYNILRSPKGHCTPRNCTAELKLVPHGVNKPPILNV